MSSSNDKQELHQLVNELLLSIRLNQHRRVSELSGEISRLLITTFDNELDQLQDDNVYDDNDDQEKEMDYVIKEALDILNVICDRLNRFSRMIDIYGEVVEFVQLQDLACLSQMVGAIRSNMSYQRQLDFDQLAKTLRQSKILLREINSIKSHQSGSKAKAKAKDDDDGDIWLDRKDIIRVDGIGLASSLINLNEFKKSISAFQQRQCLSGEDLINTLKNLNARTVGSGNANGGNLKLINLMQSQWFTELLGLLFDRIYYYPFDRFTVLISIYIVGVESGHKALQHLVGLLVDQIHHQETNSCNVDDLMQLTQVGSFWLSHRKRFLVSFRQRADMDTLNKESQLEEDDIEEEDQRYEDSSEDQEDEMNQSNQEPLHSLKSIDITVNKQQLGRQPYDLRLELRKLIDSELLIGSNCPLCNREPSGDPLEPIHLSRCPQCSLDLNQTSYCSLSYERVEWLSLASLLNHLAPRLSTLLVLKPAEWLRQMSLVASAEEEAASRRRRPARGHSKKVLVNQETTVERMDISDTFERLTMLRERSQDRLDRHEPLHSSTSSSSSSSPEESLGDGDGHGDGYLPAEKLMRVHLRETLLLAQSGKQSPETGPAPSQSLAMIRRLVAGPGGGGERQQQVALCSSDLVISDSLNDLVKLKLWLVRPTTWKDKYATVGELAAGGESSSGRGRGGRQLQPMAPTLPVLVCQSRSAISQLQLGCGRRFIWPQLARSTGSRRPAPAELACPKCAGHLIELATFCEGL